MLSYNGKTIMYNGTWTKPLPSGPMLRFQFTDTSYVPTDGTASKAGDGVWIPIDPQRGIWDFYVNKTRGYYYLDNTFANRLTPTVLGQNNTCKIILSNDTGELMYMSDAFLRCTSLTEVLCGFDFSGCFDPRGIFSGCTSLTNVTGPLDFSTLPLNYPSVSNLFTGCASLTTLPIINLTGVKSAGAMFSDCSSLVSVRLVGTGSLVDILHMFGGCTSLTAVPDSFDTSNVENMNSAFAECTSLTSIPLLATDKVTDIRGAFGGCTNVASGALALYTQASSQANPPARYDWCFSNCGSDTVTGAAELAQIPTSWGGTLNA